MEEDFPESPLNDECSKTEAIQDSLQDLKLDRVLQDQQDQSPERLRQDQEQQSLHSSLVQVPVKDEENTQDRVERIKCPPEPREDQLMVQGVDQNPTQGSGEESDLSQVERHRSIRVRDQGLLQAEQSQDPGQRVDLDRGKECCY